MRQDRVWFSGLLKPVAVLAIGALLGGCVLAKTPGRSVNDTASTVTATALPPARVVVETPPPERAGTRPDRRRTTPPSTIIDRGSDRATASIVSDGSGYAQIQRFSRPEFELNLVNASIAEAARAVLGDALKLTYSIDGGVEGRITLETSMPLDGLALFEAFQASLEFNGATISESGGRFQIVPTAQAAPKFVTPSNRRAIGRRIVVIPLSFISTREMLRILEPIVSNDAILQANHNRNVLLVSGNQAEIDAIVNAVNVFDVDVLKGKSVALFRMRSASPEAVAKELERIFEVGESGSLEGLVSFIPNERLGSILVITSRARYLREAEAWIRRLDATADRASRHTVVYPLQNRPAIELLPVLKDFVDAWSRTLEVVGEGENDELLVEGGTTKVVADDASNAIVAYATGPEHDELRALIEQLDGTPAQVLIEATIAEVLLNDELKLGVRWFFENGNFSVGFSDLVTGGVTSSFPGFSLLFDGGSALVALNALSSVTDVNIVSTPSLLVLDNREAELRVGDQVPVATQSAVDVSNPDAPIVNTIEFRDTGVILKIRPRVGSSGRVIMDIEQEVSDVVETTTSGIDSPTISQRVLKTSVAVDSGQTLALGGLIEDSTSIVNRKVPLLGDIPVVGTVFRSKDDDVERRELLILITPRVIRDGKEARAITEEFRRRVSKPDALLDRGDDTERHSVNRLVR